MSEQSPKASSNVVWHHATITRARREAQNGHRGAILWFTDLCFSAEDRVENIRRIGEVAKLFMEAGVIVLTAFISPFRADRERVRGMVEHGDFIEVYCDSPLAVCEARDVKGMYKKARTGEIAEFTGISSPYEAPENPELQVDTGSTELDQCVRQVLDGMLLRGILKRA